MAALATLKKPAKFTMVHQLHRLSLPTGLIDMALLDSSKINQRLLDANTRDIKKRKRFLQLAGLRFLTILCKFLIFLKILIFSGKFRPTALLDWKMEQCCSLADMIGEVTVTKQEFGN